MLCFGGSEHFPFARWPRKPFNGKPNCLQSPAYTAFCRIGNQNTFTFERPVHFGEHFLRPEFGLYPCPKGIKVNKVEQIGVVYLPKILFLLAKCEVFGDRDLFIPWAAVHIGERFFQAFGPQLGAIVQLVDFSMGNGIGLNPNITDFQVQLFRLLQRYEGIETCTKAHFQ